MYVAICLVKKVNNNSTLGLMITNTLLGKASYLKICLSVLMSPKGRKAKYLLN